MFQLQNAFMLIFYIYRCVKNKVQEWANDFFDIFTYYKYIRIYNNKSIIIIKLIKRSFLILKMENILFY